MKQQKQQKQQKNTLTSDWKTVQWVLTDVDDTLTWQGKLPPETLIALADLQQAGIKVVAVTGACAGWCDHIAQLWPVDAVIGENGAFIMEKKEGYLTLTSDASMSSIKKNQAKLKAQVMDILADYPDLNLTLDQSYRLCEVAIDIGQNRESVAPDIIAQVVCKINKLGAHATASSIHINSWYGEHSKKITSLNFLQEKGLSKAEIISQTCYIGDSMNDQFMFAALPKSVGVANIKHYWDKLQHHPEFVMTEPGGYGFAQFAKQLLAIKAG
ncbi:HAD-IIB family hydrolase [Psychromonas sp. Urea-02u-13]|uniref:HAD-IIB family hydrolase n=1 Tax=Psychromonas sp. Urea-02u-13 TaxID=2058326 RepID=UPI000C3260A5|nr:HAD-IIB family hydrolase [Psychromonas sp. Urea-02u-13]PKG38011.1 hydrolase [Psychromonas sp. Urea-02u-13]